MATIWKYFSKAISEASVLFQKKPGPLLYVHTMISDD